MNCKCPFQIADCAAVATRLCRRHCCCSPAAAAAAYAACSWMVLFLFGHLRDFYRKKIYGGRSAKKEKEGYAPIRQDYEVRACLCWRRMLGVGAKLRNCIWQCQASQKISAPFLCASISADACCFCMSRVLVLQCSLHLAAAPALLSMLLLLLFWCLATGLLHAAHVLPHP